MLPYLSLFGRLMPTYGVLGMAGLGFGLLAALLRCKRFGLCGAIKELAFISTGITPIRALLESLPGQ